jgi:hypothetical protein
MTKKWLLQGGTNTDTYKNPATSIIGQKPEMEGRYKYGEPLDFSVLSVYTLNKGLFTT